MDKLNDNFTKIIKAIIAIVLYFIWPTITSYVLHFFKLDSSSIGSFLFYFILFISIVTIYLKDIVSSFPKLSLKKMLCLFFVLTIVQILTNLLSVSIIGVDNHSNYGGLLPTYLAKWPILMGISISIFYPVVETLIFCKTLKDIINSKWAFILCSSLFFWLVNLLAFDFRYLSLIATFSCFTTSIVINYFYYKEDNISLIIVVKMIYNLVFLLIP